MNENEIERENIFSTFKETTLLDHLRSIYLESYIDKTGKVPVKLKKLNEDQMNDRKYLQSEFDETIAEKARQLSKQYKLKIMMHNDEYHRIMDQNRKIEDDIINQEEENGKCTSKISKVITQKHNVFKEIEVDTIFYKHAKEEIAGYHRDSNQQSEFFKLCHAHELLPQPLYKCIASNELCYNGKMISSK